MRKQSKFSRRKFLALSTSGAASVLLGLGRQTTLARGRLTGRRAVLPIPPILEGTADGSTMVYELTQQQGLTNFLPGFQTPTWGYNGSVLGPTLKLRTGQQVSLRVTNNIGVKSTTHWHGLHVPASMDGGPHQEIEPGETWNASFEVLNRAAMYWYHPHPHAMLSQGVIFDPESTGYQVYQGLAGMMIIEDELSDTLALPRTYGVDDIPLILQDRRFHPDGTLLHFPDDFNPATDAALRKGDHFFVNGVEAAVLDVGAQVVRLRILNASNVRIYNLGFSDNRTFHQVVSDGGFLADPVPLNRLLMAPAERAEILVDFGADEGQSLFLRCFNGGNGTRFVPTRLQDVYDTLDFDLLEINVGSSTAGAILNIPSSLTTIIRIPEEEATNLATPRPFELQANPFTINGNRMDINVINERIRLGDTEIWEITNPNMQAHPFHVHGDSFQILTRNGVPAAENELGWKDVVLVRPFETVRIIKRFHDFADPDNPYMFHCHILEHEDVGMMGQFVVEDPAATSVEEDQLLGNAPIEVEIYPNPFNASATISFTLASAGTVRLSVFDVLGRRLEMLIDGYLATGKHEVRFDGSSRPSGIYMYRFELTDGRSRSGTLLHIE